MMPRLIAIAFLIFSALSGLAQESDSSDLLRIRTIRPRPPAKLQLGERASLEVRYKNPGPGSVHVFALPAPTIRGSMSSGSGTYERGSGTVNPWFCFNEPTQVQEIIVTLVDSATRKVIAKETVAVQMIWGDVDAATAGTKPAPQQPANVRPGPAPKQPTNQGKMMRLQLQGYEVSQDTVGALFMAQSKELNPKAMLSAVSALVASGKATLVKMPSVQAASGARAKSEDDSDYTLELEMVRGADKSYVSANYYLRQKSGPGTIANGFLTRMGEVTVLGNVAGSSAEKLVLVFGRVTDE